MDNKLVFRKYDYPAADDEFVDYIEHLPEFDKKFRAQQKQGAKRKYVVLDLDKAEEMESEEVKQYLHIMDCENNYRKHNTHHHKNSFKPKRTRKPNISLMQNQYNY